MSCQTLPDDVAMNTGCIDGSSSSLDQIYRLLSRDGLSSDFAENSRVLFGKHTLLCELFKKRAEKKPLFLQRDLRYKIQAKQNKRIQITISVSGSSNAEVQAQNIFPLYALFAKPISNILYEGQMTFEEVLSDHDSEDEVDDDIADFEDRKMLDSYDDIAKEEKCVMHMWNAFVSRQRVKAENHIPFACKAFSQLHGQLLARSPSLLGCWRLLMIKLWNNNLLNAEAMSACNLIIDGFKTNGSDPK